MVMQPWTEIVANAFPHGIRMVPFDDGDVRELEIQEVFINKDDIPVIKAYGWPNKDFQLKLLKIEKQEEDEWVVELNDFGKVALRPLTEREGYLLSGSTDQASSQKNKKNKKGDA